MSKYSKTYIAWKSMKARCAQKQKSRNYGSKGIAYDSSWEDYKVFLLDMGVSPPESVLDRIDNDKGYYKENCRWTTPTESVRNRGKFCNNSSGVTGVHPYKAARRKKKWTAYITINYKRKFLGYFNSIEEAIIARKTAEQELWN